MNERFDFWFWFNVIANICQVESYNMNLKQISNDELMKYLNHQDNDFLKEIINQNNVIIKQNEEIIKLLEKR